MRWSSPELGAVSPGEFIPLAESSGLIVDMGNWAIAEACRQGSHWGSQGLDLSVSVNVSAHNLMAEGFLDTIAQALRESHFMAGRLILELTESTLINASGQVIELLAQLESMGIRIAIDDFGTGYSSFAYLRQFPLDRLKIDKSFVDDIEEDSNARSIVAAIIDLGHHLNLQVLAEGVETPGQLEALQELGCDLYQGFLSSPAIAPDAVKELALQL
jgi:EAL domain-containing protein (putative c-di-GMP-specific phosphodiesterase class I)